MRGRREEGQGTKAATKTPASFYQLFSDQWLELGRDCQIILQSLP